MAQNSSNPAQDTNFTHAANVALGAQNAANSARQGRTYTGMDVSKVLSRCVIPAQGPNKLELYGRGSDYTRNSEQGGRAIRIFNVLAFADAASRERAKLALIAGFNLESAGALAEAQTHYRKALEEMMSFSVTQENADAFTSTYEILCKVELVDTKDRVEGSPTFGQVIGKKLGINNPRPVAVEQKGEKSADFFSLPTAQIPMSNDANAALQQQVQTSGAGDTNLDE